MINLVYAQDIKGGIGYQGDLPWHLPNDLKFFKKTTMDHTMVMGRKTFESMNCRLLPGRKTIVLTKQKDYGKDIEGLETISSLEEILERSQEEDLMVIGGAQVFKLVWDQADQIFRTVIEAEFPADTFMPVIDLEEWLLIKETPGLLDDKNLYPHKFQCWQRKGAHR